MLQDAAKAREECRLECATAMQGIDLAGILIAGVSIRKSVIREW
jgi:hypothetical protein